MRAIVSLGIGLLKGQAQLRPDIAMDVNYVLIHASVMDEGGNAVTGLDETSFRVFENGKRQSLRLFRHEDRPVTVGIVVDHSKSMQRKLPDAIATARAFAGASNPEDEMFVVNFNDVVRSGLSEDKPFSSRSEDIVNAIEQMLTEGQTALYDAVAFALETQTKARLDKKVLIVISDGEDTKSGLRFDDLLRIAERTDVLIYAIGFFGEPEDIRSAGVLKRLARATGGEAYFPADVSEATSISRRIAREIRSQYTLAYLAPENQKPGEFRRIRVEATQYSRRLLVRARKGYTLQPFRPGDPE